MNNLKFLGTSYLILSLVATITLSVSFFVVGVNPITQVVLLLQSVGFAWVSSFYLIKRR